MSQIPGCALDVELLTGAKVNAAREHRANTMDVMRIFMAKRMVHIRRPAEAGWCNWVGSCLHWVGNYPV